jgi:hypothetical protein
MPDPRRPAPPTPPLAARSLLQLASETLALGCLFERRGDAYIRLPVHRRQQMAGCEWHCRRPGGLLRRVSYTFEPLDGWTALAKEAPERVVTLYRSILGRPDIALADLVWRSDVFARRLDGYVLAFPAGSYNPLNAWNTVRGAVHLNGSAEAGFDGAPRLGPGRLRLSVEALERGLLFLGGCDRTADVLQAARREGRAGTAGRLEVSVPEGEDWSLEDLTLPDGERFTPLGLFQLLLGVGGGAQGGWSTGSSASPALPVWRGTMPVLPGQLVRGAMLRRLHGAPLRSVLA